MEFSLTLRNCFHISFKRINLFYLYQYEQFVTETKFESKIKLNLEKLIEDYNGLDWDNSENNLTENLLSFILQHLFIVRWMCTLANWNDS